MEWLTFIGQLIPLLPEVWKIIVEVLAIIKESEAPKTTAVDLHDHVKLFPGSLADTLSSVVKKL